MADSNQQLSSIFNYHPSDTALLVVSHEQKEMLVHQSYISAHSEFFRVALKREWREGQTRVVKIPEDEPEVVAQYLDFVYHRKLPTLHKCTADCHGTMYTALAKLYVYGERALDCVIRNKIIDHLIGFTTAVNQGDPRHSFYPGPSIVDIIYDGTMEGSPIRRLLVDMYARHRTRNWLSQDLHPSFSLDVARELMGQVEGARCGCCVPAIRISDYYVAS